MARATPIGRGRCPVCANDRARIGLTASQLACLTCDACNAQVFARSDKSDTELRRLVKPEPESAPAPAADPAPVAEIKPEATPQKPARERVGWGILG